MRVFKKTEEFFKITLTKEEFEKVKVYLKSNYDGVYIISSCDLWSLTEEFILNNKNDFTKINILTFKHIDWYDFEVKAEVYREVIEVKPYNPNT